MINDYWIESKFGMEYVCRIVWSYKMGSYCCTEGVYGMEDNFSIVKAFRVFIEKGMLNDFTTLPFSRFSSLAISFEALCFTSFFKKSFSCLLHKQGCIFTSSDSCS